MANQFFGDNSNKLGGYDDRLEDNIELDKTQQHSINDISSRMTLAESSTALQNINITQLLSRVAALEESEGGGVDLTAIELRLTNIENYLSILSNAIYLENNSTEINFTS